MATAVLREKEMGLWEKFACPRTGAALAPGADGSLAGEGVAYAVEEGVIRFRDTSMKGEAADLAALARVKGCSAALEEVAARDRMAHRYVTDTARLEYLRVVPVGARSEVLEIGASMGQHTVELARRARSVHALEVDGGQCRFIAERCRQEGLTNVSVACGGEDCRLPYRDGSFDVVILNLVLEWCGGLCDGESPESAQRRMLGEIARVLRVGGVLFVATKNRFALRLLLGKRDEHMHEMRFGSALPRSVMRWRLRRAGKAGPGGWLHSHNGLRRMLELVGFGEMRSYWAAPEMRYPERFVPTESAAVRRARRERGFAQGEFRSTRAMMRLVPAWMVKHVMPGLAFVARKRGAGGAE